MKFLTAFFSIFLCFNSYGIEKKFEDFFIARAIDNGIDNDVKNLLKTKKISKTSSIEDRISMGKIQLSFEQAIDDCIEENVCQKVKSIIKTPLPATPLRVTEETVSKVSGTDNKEINNILLKRKSALVEYISHKNSKLLIAYGYEGLEAINYKVYKNIIEKYDNILDCKYCYDFFDEINNSGAIYKITANNNQITFIVENAQLKEPAKKNQNFVLSYSAS